VLSLVTQDHFDSRLLLHSLQFEVSLALEHLAHLRFISL